MGKLRFEFVVKAGDDQKTNIICITSITTTSGQMFNIPDALQPARMHETITKTQTYQKVKTSLQRRHDKRQVWISLTEEISTAYLDEEGNMEFKGYLLEEITPTTPQQEATITGISEETLTRILASFSEQKKDIPKHHNIKTLSEKFVIEKFTRKISNVTQWLYIFEGECTRLGVEEDIEKIEILRLFLGESCLDWYSSMLIKHTINSDWSIWRNNICETYADKGWTPVRYAILFKYIQGSLLEYALKKERLLLEINKSIDKPTLIDLISTGLPNFIADKIERNKLKDTHDLFNFIRGLEHLVNNRKDSEKKMAGFESKMKEKNGKYKPCRICEKENKGVRYHPESLCWFQNKNSDGPKKDQMRYVNNSALETELNEIDQKN